MAKGERREKQPDPLLLDVKSAHCIEHQILVTVWDEKGSLKVETVTL